MSNSFTKITEDEVLNFHQLNSQPGKVSLKPTKPLLTQHDLSLAYSPGVAVPCIKIKENSNSVYDYTAKGNYVAVISNGSAVLGLGNLGALASKPVMEGKAVLFKRFAGIDAVDLEVDTENIDEFIHAVKYLGPSWGGINLEDIKSPDCFIIEKKLQEIMDIPVFHDDQHGTAIIVGAGIINAVDITGRKLKDLKIVVNGPGAAGAACINLLKLMGITDITACDQHGVIYHGRDNLNEWKAKHAIETDKRSLSDAMKGADVFLGLSVKDVLTSEMVKSMADAPIIFAMANPDPEIKPEIAKQARPDVIIATGRSDYNNQINNVMGFPYIFRGALDVRAKKVNNEMKLAAVRAIADLAREPVIDEVSAAYSGRKMQYGPDYIVPTPFDSRLMTEVAPAVAKAAMESGVARKSIENWQEYRQQLNTLLSPTSNIFDMLLDRVRENKKRIIFSEGEEERVIKAALEWCGSGCGMAMLVGRQDKIQQKMKELGITDTSQITIANAAISKRNDEYIKYMYEKLQRKGFLYRTCVRAVKTDRNIFASCMLACGDGDVLITGLTRSYNDSLQEISRIIECDEALFGLSVIMINNNSIFLADTAINNKPSGDQLAKIAIKAADKVKQMGEEPRIAFISSSTFSNNEKNKQIYVAMEELKKNKVIFEYDGEMEVDVALSSEALTAYPFCKLSKSANVLIMPNLDSANIAAKLLKKYGAVVVDPILVGMKKSVQIAQMTSITSEIYNLALLAVLDSIDDVNN
ncbi:MAG: NADP-dependent malic enzyme [Rickettsiaceae bacterium H1]|nr:NADP-dependent malic enzyme [Rickettsiaceae bacterium H1]